jgi:hypothetical protein
MSRTGAAWGSHYQDFRPPLVSQNNSKTCLPSYGWSVLLCSLSQPYGQRRRFGYFPSRRLVFPGYVWQVVLEYAAEHHLQFGKEIVFTYGPLGYLLTDVSLGHMLNERIVFAFALSLFMAWSVVGGPAGSLVLGDISSGLALLFGTFSSGADNFFFLLSSMAAF